jgi:hypothetical protein
MDCEASKVDAVNQAPTGSAQPANLVVSRPLVKPQRTTESAWAVHQLKSTERNKAGMRRPFVTRGKLKVKDLPKLKRKIRMALDEINSSGSSTHQPKLEARKRGLRRDFEAKLNIKEESVPELIKENMDLDDNRSSGKGKKGKTKEDTKDVRPHPHPGRKVHVVSLDDDAIEDTDLAYHKKFLENVFGSRASKITIAHSYPDGNWFGAWLTDEEVDILSGQDLVFRVKCTHDREITLEGSN